MLIAQELATLLKQAANNSYRLDKIAYEPLNITISSSLNVIKTLENEIETVDKAIEKTVKGLNPVEYQSLISVKGIDPVISSGIISEIGTIASFQSHDSLAKFAGLTWRKRQSGNYSSFSFFKPILCFLKVWVLSVTPIFNNFFDFYLLTYHRLAFKIFDIHNRHSFVVM